MSAATARAVLPAGSRVPLFGSLADVARRGGGIGLRVEPPSPWSAPAQVGLRSPLAARLYLLMGERRVDTQFCAATPSDDRLIVAQARQQAVELVRM